MTKPLSPIPERPFLTDAQKRVLRFIKGYIKDNDWPPTIKEITEGVGLASTATVHHHVRALYRKGYIEIGAAKSAMQLRVVSDR